MILRFLFFVTPLVQAWAPLSLSSSRPATTGTTGTTALFGYLDDLNKELRAPRAPEEEEGELDRTATQLDKSQIDRYGVGSWDSYVDFNEFDGGDGQMGVAGDGSKGLDEEWKGQSELFKSKSMSAKNAWGRSTGYANTLIDKGMDATRAQQMENWLNQRAVAQERESHRYMTDQFDQVSAAGQDEDWRTLSKFGVERNQDFDLDETMGAVTPGSTVYHHIELTARLNQPRIFEFDIVNSFMGYSDFRARFNFPTTEWTVEPSEGSLNGKTGTEFVVKYRPQNPGVSTGYLVIETEDDKWTFQVTGSASM